jgi:hypothetical protein
MSADSSWPLQQAVYDALRNATAVQALVGNPARIYDHVPAETVFPYLIVGESQTIDWSTKSYSGVAAEFAIHSWSRGRGRKQVKEILDAVHGVLHQAALAVTGHNVIELRFRSAESLLDEDGLTWHGVTRFRALTHL